MSVTGVFCRPGGRAGFRHLRAKSRRYAAVALRNAPAGAVWGEFLFHVEKEPKDARGSAQDGHFVSIFAVPLEPPLRELSLGPGRAFPAHKI